MPRVRTIDDPRYVKAMSHPLRIRVIAMLRERTATPAQLARWLGVSVGTVSYHVRALERLGLVELVRTTQVRGAVAHHYRAARQPVITDDAWAGASSIAKQAAVGAALAIIHEYASASAAAGGFDRAHAQLTRSDLRLDTQGWEELSTTVGRLLDDIQRIERSAADRMKRRPHHEHPTNASVVVLAFDAVPLTGAGENERKHSKRRERVSPG